MSATYRPLTPGFSTADAGRPRIEYAGGGLAVHFVDWREQPVTVEFADVVAFRWQDEAKLPPEARDDTAYEVLDSPWLAELRALGAAREGHRHYLLCFNARGVLDVISGPLPAAG